jgi:hypothetical protein
MSNEIFDVRIDRSRVSLSKNAKDRSISAALRAVDRCDTHRRSQTMTERTIE